MTSEPRTDFPEGGGRGTEPGRVARFFGGLLRLLFTAFLGVLLGAGVYWGAPALYRAFMEPVEANTARLEEIEAALEALDAEGRAATGRLGERISEVEGNDVSQRERLSELSIQLERSEEGLREVEDRIRALERETDRLERVEEALILLEEQLAELAQEEEPSSTQQALQERLQLLRMMELVARARLEILSENYGLARENIAFAQASAEEQIDEDRDSSAGALEAVVARLQAAGESLDESPDLAAVDLEAAWRLLAEATSR